ncbi:Aste57867_10767 [Aphanomyces stellatus]|uniref:Aste57867_10767 protein n=1 Tax=Aphanomyces stellatus TaxID=120398 RepID=A0A485KRA0_9STRA|nr:hypothetical protein As57867_010727 [Aphanomyces stellatus]VFT87637.1 Aste57867_10767 [Aphanomyces stellatus]
MAATISSHHVSKTCVAFLLNHPAPSQRQMPRTFAIPYSSPSPTRCASTIPLAALLNDAEKVCVRPSSPWKKESSVQDLVSFECVHEMIPSSIIDRISPAPQTHRSLCQVDGCATAAVSKGRCVRHGGGTRCVEPGCNKRTKRFRRCFLHGGFVYCNIEGCASKAKRFGRCWAHGGGSLCAESGCEKLAVKSGLCWTHGGGSRCRVQDCWRRSYKRCDFYCDEHFGCVQAGSSVECVSPL